MTEILLGLGSALWLGILTSISPCPLATNIAAVSYLSKKIEHPKAVLIAGISYTLGRMILYTILGAAIIASLFNVPVIANFLQVYINRIVGPILIVSGLFILDIVKIKIPSFSMSHKRQNALAGSGAWGAFALGFLFALSFCPISAALFFGSLIPLALQNQAGITLTFVYGLGTGLPVLLLSLLLSLGVLTMEKIMHKFSRVEYYSRRATGVIFLAAGLYFLWSYIIMPWMKW
jgi:cytochrome c-type biogenesis protein